ncbi:sialoadhesin-like isoform X2 [Megalobrama amblycephala]|uniref:sialoadhesin-like isoform X2 n=1 Tax=Megalobrama amblycephala TaxID=75352 RepID=UPI00201481B8|nr:sialoadhesin-like isoform X2 [Megalobrama amblycephala]
MVSSLIKSLPLIVVIMTAGVDGQQDWGVNYSPSYVCALKGTKVKISYPEERGGIQCLSEDKDTHSITLTKVTEADKHVYYCRFTTNIDGGNWTGIPGVQLDVTDLQVETQQRVKLGDSVTLTCKSSCSLTEQTTFIWYRSREILTDRTVNQLHLQSVSRYDAGNYRCGAVRGNEHLRSPPVYLKVDWVDGLQDRGVNYSPSYVCALKGSTVKISCTLTHNYKLIKGFWTKPVGESPDLCSDQEKRGGIQCQSEYEHTHSITLVNVREADKHVYYCRFTGYQNKRWTVIPGSWLDVTDLQVETQQRVKEGDSVTLTCKSSCSLTEQTTFIWYRSREILTDQTVNQLHLQSVKHSDDGNYRCAVRGHDYLRSPPVYLKVYSVDGQQDWGVNYSPSYVCALKGSTVKISCTLKYPNNHKLIKAFWTKPAGKSPDVCSDQEKRGRVWCHSEYEHTHSITLTNVREADKHVYYCRFTDDQNKRWAVIHGARLDVTDLQVETQQRVKEGDSVTLTCKSSCSLTEQTTFIWSRNTQRFTKGIEKENQLHLQSVSSSDEGNYQCEIRGNNDHLISPAVHLDVEYPPKSVSVSISPSGEIVSGDSVTLNCSSDSNPPAEISWFKEGKSVGSGRIFSISNISSDHSGEYKCRSRNKHGEENSDTVMLNVTYPPKSVSVSISPSGEIVSGDSVTLNCSSDSNPPALNFSWFKEGKSVGSGRIFSISNISSDHSGEYKCRSRNKHGEKNSDTVMLNVMYPPKSVSVSISPSGEIVSGDSVTLNCSSDSNPPALNFSWFKEDETSAVGSGQSFSISSFNSSFSGRFYCEAQNKYGSQRSASVSLTVKGIFYKQTLFQVHLSHV